jgi:alcohol dehydrogenase YqhD (iron-dependent ADH family)
VLTIPAAGSESSVASVITNEDGLLKRACGHPVLMPKFAIMNPELTYTLPAYQTVCGACDIMAHVMESYFTPAKKTDYSDRLCEATLKTVINNVRIVLREPENYEARADIMWAGTIANNNLLAMGRVQDWGSHMIEHELSALYDVTHGAGLSVIFPAWMKYVYKADVNRFVQFAVRVWGVDLAFESLDDIVLEGIRRIKAFFTEIGLPVSLKELDIPDDKFEEMAAKCTAGGPVGSFKKIYREDAVKVYELAK